MSDDSAKTQQVVHLALDEAFKRAVEHEKQDGQLAVDLKEDKFVLFSDLHKGNRDGADDFRVCERAYNAALAYYERMGYTLVLLGDVEELWEEEPKTVVETYKHTFELEGKFHRNGRYLRIWGNHDDAWNDPDLVNQLLVPKLGGNPLDVHETAILNIHAGGILIGRIFLTHGHQGTLESDRFALISAWLVRNFWRPIQRIIKFSFNTPAKDFQLRHAHDEAMYLWSEAQEKVILIAGHTHRPVFNSENHEIIIRKSIKQAEDELAKNPSDKTKIQEIAELSSELEWILAQNQRSISNMPLIEFKKPSYFNTGCCAFLDGDITGLEISEGKIKLVRWPDDDDTPKPRVLAEAELTEVFEKC